MRTLDEVVEVPLEEGIGGEVQTLKVEAADGLRVLELVEESVNVVRVVDDDGDLLDDVVEGEAGLQETDETHERVWFAANETYASWVKI